MKQNKKEEKAFWWFGKVGMEIKEWGLESDGLTFQNARFHKLIFISDSSVPIWKVDKS